MKGDGKWQMEVPRWGRDFNYFQIEGFSEEKGWGRRGRRDRV